MKGVNWSGVYPAVTTQFVGNPARDVDFNATATVMQRLIRDGVSGLIVCGTVGEASALTRAEKRSLFEVARDVAGNRVTVIGGVAERGAVEAAALARDAEQAGLDGIMLMPPLSYATQPAETVAFFSAVAGKTALPIMVYNNPPMYRVDVTPSILAELAIVDNIVAFKDSSGDTRRFVDLQNAVGDRYVLFAGLDDVVLESIAVGAVGWVSGMSNAFPAEGNALFQLAARGHFKEALPLIAGSCRCCISMRDPIWFNASSIASGNLAAVRT